MATFKTNYKGFKLSTRDFKRWSLTQNGGVPLQWIGTLGELCAVIDTI